MNTSITFKIWIIVIIFCIVTGVLFFSFLLPDTGIPTLTKNARRLFKNLQPVTEVNIKGHSLSPIASNQWYSNVYKKFPTEPLFALPVVYQLTQNGLAFSYPDIKPTEKTVFAGFHEDFRVGLTNIFKNADIEHIGDWSIKLKMTNGQDDTLIFTLAHGVPYTTLDIASENVHIYFKNNFKITNDNKNTVTSSSFVSDSYVVTTNNHNYIFVLPQKSKHTVNGNDVVIDKPGWLFVGLLDNRSNYENFKEISDIRLQNTYADMHIEQNYLLTDYNIAANGNIPLITVFPHQSGFLTDKPEILGVYPTVRGGLELIKAKSFTTRIPLIRPDINFRNIRSGENEIDDQLKKDINDIIKKGPPDSKDYFLGTWFGKVITLIQLADVMKLSSERDALIKFVEPIFSESLSYFDYDKKQRSLVSLHPEFGNEKLNDHHLHYGYFIRTAAILVKYDPGLLFEYKDTIDNMIHDIAAHDRNSAKFPYLRNFDVYEGHSWADGYADFADGNDQESTSEAINAWYGVYLWSIVTDNSELEKYALYLFNTEVQSTFYYWFDKNGNYTKPYNHKIASVLWGGKADYATWFSGDTNMIYGIQLLPITPASSYLGKLPDFSKYDIDYHTSGGDEAKDWGDLFLIWKSFYDPDEAFAMKNRIVKPHADTPTSLFLYMLYLNKSEERGER